MTVKSSEYDILILFAPFWGPTLAPMGLGLLKAYVEKNGFSCYTLDMNAELYNSTPLEFKKYWEIKNGFYYPEDISSVRKFYDSIRELRAYYISKIVSLAPKRVGISLYTATHIFSELFLEELKFFMPDTEFLIGGPHVAPYMDNINYYLSKNYIDVIVQGEGEEALALYLTNADKIGFVEPINNVIYKRDGEIISGKYISNTLKLDDIPVPDYGDFDLTQYINKHGVNIFASRGCPNKCVFCSERNYFSNFKFRKAESMFNDIKSLMKTHDNVYEFNFADSISNASIVELEKLCDLIIESDLDIHLIFHNAVIRKEMRAPLYKKLKDAGCIVIGYGMESPNPVLLEGIGKALSKNVDIGAVIKEGTDAGIDVSINVMFGLPGETEKDFDLLMNFLKKHKNDIGQINPAINFCALYPGSFGSMEPEKWGIDLNNSADYWEIKGDNNTYLTRLERFEKFTTLAKDMGLDNLFGIEEITNKNEMVGLYYFHKGDYKYAREYLEKIPEKDISMSVEKALSVVHHDSTTIKHGENLGYLKREHKENLVSAAVLMINSDFTYYIDDLKEVILTQTLPMTKWKRRVREISHIIFNQKKYEEKLVGILSIYSSLQHEHILQSYKIFDLLKKSGLVNNLKSVETPQYNKNTDILETVLEFKKNILNINNILDKYYVINKLSQVAGYELFIRSVVELVNKVDIISNDTQVINQKIDDLENRVDFVECLRTIDVNKLIVNSNFSISDEICSFDQDVKESLAGIFRKKEPMNSYDKFIRITEQAFGLNEVKDKLAMMYRFLYILNQQNKYKIMMLSLLDGEVNFSMTDNHKL